MRAGKDKQKDWNHDAMDAATKARLWILASSFAIAAFAGMAAYLRVAKWDRRKLPELAMGAASALANGGCIGIIACAFCYWKYNGEPDMFVVFGSSSALGLGGLEMVNFVLRIVQHHMTLTPGDREKK